MFTAMGSIFITWVFLHTISYGLWTWHNNNKLGAVMLFILAGAVFVFPVYFLLY